MQPRFARAALVVFAAVLLLIGIVLAFGGIQLLLLGGSSYYALYGIAQIVAALLLWRGRRAGMWLYLLIVVYTFIWSLWEVGMDGWSLASRMGLPLLLALFFLFPRTRRQLS